MSGLGWAGPGPVGPVGPFGPGGPVGGDPDELRAQARRLFAVATETGEQAAAVARCASGLHPGWSGDAAWSAGLDLGALAARLRDDQRRLDAVAVCVRAYATALDEDGSRWSPQSPPGGPPGSGPHPDCLRGFGPVPAGPSDAVHVAAARLEAALADLAGPPRVWGGDPPRPITTGHRDDHAAEPVGAGPST